MGDIKFTTELDDAKFQSGMIRLTRMIERAERSQKRFGKTSQFSSKRILGDLKQMALGYASVGAGIAVVTQGIKRMAEEHNRFYQQRAERAMGRRWSRQRLLQLSGGDRGLFRQYGGFAERAATTYGVEAETMDRFTFDLVSSGKWKQRGLYANLFRLAGSAEEPAQMARAVKKFQMSFGQRAGGDRKLLNQFMAAAKPSDVAQFEMTMSVLKGAAGAAKFGATPEETMAAMSVIASAAPSPEIASTQFARLMDVLTKKGYKGSIAEAVGAISARGMSPARQIAYFGNVRGARGFAALAGNLGEMEQRRRAIIAAGAPGADLLGEAIRTGEQDPLMRGIWRRNRAQRLGEMGGATKELMYETWAENYKARIRGPGESSLRELYAIKEGWMVDSSIFKTYVMLWADMGRDIHRIAVAITGRSPAEVVLPKLGEGGP